MVQFLPSDLFLRPARPECGSLGGRRVVCLTPLPDVLEDVLPAGGEGLQHVGVVAVDLEHPQGAVLDRPQTIARLAEIFGQFVVVVSLDEFIVQRHAAPVEAHPLAILAAGHVRDNGVGMDLRVVVAGCIVPEDRRHHLASWNAVLIAPGLDMVLLNITESRGDGILVGVESLLLLKQQRGHRDRFRSRERQVVAGVMLEDHLTGFLVYHPTSELDALTENLPAQNGFEIIDLDRPLQLEQLRPGTDPAAGGPMLEIAPCVVLFRPARCYPGIPLEIPDGR